ncbi:transposase family protein [Nonomuraea salmonea]|uniref:Transposase family protein n=1 Tax=Nonomuraea salmonea TaxID=46181 RepID=A0ABV5NWU1_9ACTN
MSGQPQARAGDAGAARCRRRVNTGSGTLSVIGLAEWITVRTFRPVAVLLITSICRVLVKELVAVLFPHLVGVCGEQVVRSGATVRIRARTGTVEAACPSCGTRSQQVHSRYERRLSDTAVGGQEVLIHLGVRRFFCRAATCVKVTFAEQVPGLTVRYGRRWRRSLDGGRARGAGPTGMLLRRNVVTGLCRPLRGVPRHTT